MIELVIKIPESEIPKQQDIIEIPLHFIDGKVCEAGGYEFDVLPKGHGFIAICDSDFPITEEVKQKLKNTLFVGNEDCNYCFEMTEIIEADKESEK